MPRHSHETKPNAVIANPPEFVTIILPETREYAVYVEPGGGKRFVQCDLCRKFYVLRGRKDSSVAFVKHRGRGACQSYAERQIRDAIVAKAKEEEEEALRLVFGVRVSRRDGMRKGTTKGSCRCACGDRSNRPVGAKGGAGAHTGKEDAREETQPPAVERNILHSTRETASPYVSTIHKLLVIHPTSRQTSAPRIAVSTHPTATY